MLIVGGSHITYPQLLFHGTNRSKFGLCLPSKDGRILLVVPWLDRIIAGTTERKFDAPTSNPTVSI